MGVLQRYMNTEGMQAISETMIRIIRREMSDALTTIPSEADAVQELSKHLSWQLKDEAYEFLFKVVIRFCDPEQEDGPHAELCNHAIKTFTPVALNLS